MAERKIVVVSGGLGNPSSSRMLADQLAAATAAKLGAQGLAADVRVIELRDLAVDIANNFVTGYAAPKLAEAIDAVVQADGLIAVSPVFTSSFSGLWKSFFDVVDNKALDGLPVLMGATGGSARHSLVLEYSMRLMFNYLRARVTPTAVFAAPEDWGGAGGIGGQLDSRVNRAAGELAGMLREVRADKGAPPLESLPFEQLLAQISTN